MDRLEEIQERIEVIEAQEKALATEREMLSEEMADMLSPATSFGFLYSRDGLFDEDDQRHRWCRGKTVDEAAQEMARFINGRVERYNWYEVRVDSEAEHKDEHVDLYQIGEAHPLYQYLP